MQDEKIFKIALITTIIGLIGLITTAGFVEANHKNINEIDKSQIDNQIQITGEVINITNTKSGTKIIKIADTTGTINAIAFKNTEINIHTGENVTITGKVA